MLTKPRAVCTVEFFCPEQQPQPLLNILD